MKILYVNGGVLDKGGISTYMMNFYRCFDKDKIHIDFLTQGSGENMYVGEIEANGGNVYQIPSKSTNLIKNAILLYKIIKDGNYDIVHAHADAGNGFILYIAKKAGIRIRISHSHSTNFYTKSKIKRLFNNIQKMGIEKNATHFWGCSKEACKWLYPNNENYSVINNAIDLSKFQFKNIIRSYIRRELNIPEDCISLCQIGHLNYIKNQEYSIRIIETIVMNYPERKVKLFLVGDGEDKEKLIHVIDNSIAKKNVIMLGIREDVFNILQGMDALLMPSLFEGFPVTAVESQASGLFSLLSENITSEVCFDNQMIKFLPIEEKNLKDWAEACLHIPSLNREQAINVVANAGFDIRTEALALQNRYIELTKGGKM